MKTNYDLAAEAYDVMLANYVPGITAMSYTQKQKRDFVNAVIALSTLEYELPFSEDAEARNALYTMRLNCSIWKKDYKKNATRKCRMLRAACQLCDMNRLNPFDKPEEEVSLDAQAEIEIEQTVAEDLASGTARVFFGVIDEEDV